MNLYDIIFACCIGVSAESLAQAGERQLYVNTKPEHYSMEKSRRSGESDLMQLCMKETNEEAWVFVQANDGKAVWYEDGTLEGNRSAFYDSPLRRWAEIDNAKYLSFYHFHPQDNNTVRGIDLSQLPTVSKDISSFIVIIKAFELSAPWLAANIDFRIAVSTGVYTFKFDISKFYAKDEADNFYNAIEGMRNELRYINAGLSEKFDYNLKNKANFAEQNRKLAEMFSTPVMKITFEEIK